MKTKIMAAAVCLTSAFLLFSCATTKVPGKVETPVHNTYKNKEPDITLIGNTTTGYTWCFDIENEDVIAVKDDVTYNGAEGVMGATSTFRYYLTGLTPGYSTLTFEYKRPWETNAAPLRKLTYQIDVSDNLKVTAFLVYDSDISDTLLLN